MTPIRQAALLLALALLSGGASAQQPAGQGIAAGPQFTPGLVLRYQLDLRTTTEGHVQGAVANPQGSARVLIAVSAAIRVEALSPEGEGAPVTPVREPSSSGLQIRASFEQVRVEAGGDTFDPAVDDVAQRYRQLEGFALVYSTQMGEREPGPTLESSKLWDPSLEAMAKALLRSLVLGPSAPLDARPGHSWTVEHPILSAPLKDTLLHSESSYQRDEPCGGQAERQRVSVPSLAVEPCAVMLTRTHIRQSRRHGDLTPDHYQVRGLRTAGHWEGSGESLAYIAHGTGWVVNVTETQSEQMDFTVSRATGDVVLRRRGTVETQTHLLLQSVETRK